MLNNNQKKMQQKNQDGWWTDESSEEEYSDEEEQSQTLNCDEGGGTCDPASCAALAGHCCNGHFCADDDSVCCSGKCVGFKCSGGNNGDTCESTSQCNSGSICDNGKCTNVKGICSPLVSPALCYNHFNWEGGKYCNGYPNCMDNTDCCSGICGAGICSAGGAGDACRDNTQCDKDKGFICDAGKCTNAKGICSPQPDALCYDHFTIEVDGKTKYCNGYTPCTNNGDCCSGMCSDGTCTDGAAGTKCVFTNQCAGDLVCDAGTCANNATKDSCYPSEASPKPQNCYKHFSTEKDAKYCNGYPNCQYNTDCCSGMCSGGICSDGSADTICFADNQCATGLTCEGPEPNFSDSSEPLFPKRCSAGKLNQTCTVPGWPFKHESNCIEGTKCMEWSTWGTIIPVQSPCVDGSEGSACAIDATTGKAITGFPCQDGLSCIPDNSSQPFGKCTTQKLGDSCMLLASGCENGLFCAPTDLMGCLSDLGSGVCASPKPNGINEYCCHDDICENGYCSTLTDSTPNTCRPYQQKGQACGLTEPCDKNLICVAQPNDVTSAVCSDKSDGSPCVIGPADCTSSYCKSGVWAPMPFWLKYLGWIILGSVLALVVIAVIIFVIVIKVTGGEASNVLSNGIRSGLQGIQGMQQLTK